LNVVNAQMSPLCNRSNVDKQLQPNFPRNELSLAVDKNTLISMRRRPRDRS